MGVAFIPAALTQLGVVFGSLMLETTLSEIPGLVGTTLGPSDWQEMTQTTVDTFAGLTNDFNFIPRRPRSRRSDALSAGQSRTASSHWR